MMAKSKEDIRKKRSTYSRIKNVRERRKNFLIVCEGEKTEPLYFSAFRVPKEIYDVKGTGYNTVSLVEEAIRLSQNGTYNQIWVVMDKDSFSVDQFNQALQLAKNNDIQIAYSNEAFELWYLLHFDFHQSAISRSSYKQRLTDKLGFAYRKKDPRIFRELETRLPDAIQNAKRLLSTYGNNHSPARDNPSTNVHVLVMELQKYAV
jgi:hypothetical protein